MTVQEGTQGKFLCEVPSFVGQNSHPTQSQTQLSVHTHTYTFLGRTTRSNADSDLVVTLEELLHNPLPGNNGPCKDVRKQRLGESVGVQLWPALPTFMQLLVLAAPALYLHLSISCPDSA